MNKKILILDDDEDILEILSMLLDDSGYKTKTLNCGEAVFNEIRDFNPDLILMDVMLADMDGRAICKDIKNNIITSLIPVILISATHDLHKVLDLPGAPNDFVAKPFDIDHLLKKIELQLAS